MTRVLAGRRPVLEAMRGNAKLSRIYTEPQRAYPDICEAAEAQGIPIANRDRAGLDKLSDGVRHQGVVALAEDFQFCEPEEIIAHAEGPPSAGCPRRGHRPAELGRHHSERGDPRARWFDHSEAPCSGDYGGRRPRICRSHRARIDCPSHQSAANAPTLSESGLEIIGLDAGGDIDVRDLEPSPRGRVLVVGSEGKGLRRMVRQRCDIVVHIRQEGPMDSLNASVAAAIAMYEISAKQLGVAHDG